MTSMKVRYCDVKEKYIELAKRSMIEARKGKEREKVGFYPLWIERIVE